MLTQIIFCLFSLMMKCNVTHEDRSIRGLKITRGLLIYFRIFIISKYIRIHCKFVILDFLILVLPTK